MEENEFKKLVETALDDLPPHITEHLDNVAVVVEPRPSARSLKKTGTRKGSILLGLYEGVPQTAWGRGHGGNLPDKITIFKESIEMFAKTPNQIEYLVRNTVWHEIAHHFGYDDDGIRELEGKRKNSQK
ncbi:MAG: metallopeptidase family protein [Candidatus Spechtbacterales bacterium]